jgi:hypothetical protein
MLWRVLSAVVCVAAFAAAASTVGTVSSGGPIKINETAVPATAAVSVPVALGDRVSTGDAEAVIRLEPFGALVTLAPKSSFEIGEVDGKPFIRLLSGSLHYKLTDVSKLQLFKKDRPVPAALDGILAFTKHTTAIVLATAGGAAAVITTVALVTRSPSVPAGQAP